MIGPPVSGRDSGLGPRHLRSGRWRRGLWRD